MSQTIDLAAAVSATFNGSDLSEIKLNSASCWTKPGGGYSLYTLVPGAPLNRTCLASDYTLGTYAGGTTITETLSLANAALVNRGFFFHGPGSYRIKDSVNTSIRVTGYRF